MPHRAAKLGRTAAPTLGGVASGEGDGGVAFIPLVTGLAAWGFYVTLGSAPRSFNLTHGGSRPHDWTPWPISLTIYGW